MLPVPRANGLVLGADAPKDDVKKDKDKLQGTWKAVTAEAGGKSQDDAEEHRLIFSGDAFTVKKGEETMIQGKFKIDPSKKPKEIDMEFTKSQREHLNGKTALGIYELDADTLKSCWNKPGGERPKKFSSEAANVHLLVTLKREKSNLSGTWGKKGGEQKIEFADQGVLKIVPHGGIAVIAIVCNYTVEKEGLVKVKITGFEGKEEVKQKVQEKVPVGLTFAFKWAVNGDSARLDVVMGDDIEALKSHLDGDFEQEK